MSTETEKQAGAGLEAGSLLDSILDETKMKRGDEAYEVTRQGVQAFIAEMLKGRDAKKIDKAAVDAMITEPYAEFLRGKRRFTLTSAPIRPVDLTTVGLYKPSDVPNLLNLMAEAG